mmetsp:Transcript_38376/g.96306  ORF Transcript_38376/g.96306 Transcript_38376/m.96306 type:complete len:297 (-) Transcript_38376:341-1231(-)
MLRRCCGSSWGRWRWRRLSNCRSSGGHKSRSRGHRRCRNGQVDSRRWRAGRGLYRWRWWLGGRGRELAGCCCITATRARCLHACPCHHGGPEGSSDLGRRGLRRWRRRDARHFLDSHRRGLCGLVRMGHLERQQLRHNCLACCCCCCCCWGRRCWLTRRWRLRCRHLCRRRCSSRSSLRGRGAGLSKARWWGLDAGGRDVRHGFVAVLLGRGLLRCCCCCCCSCCCCCCHFRWRWGWRLRACRRRRGSFPSGCGDYSWPNHPCPLRARRLLLRGLGRGILGSRLLLLFRPSSCTIR